MEEQDNIQDISVFEEEETIDEEDEQVNLAEVNSPPIHTYIADVEVESLYKKYKRERLNIQPSFQRQFVWDAKKCSRLIESAIMRVPLPAIYLFEEEDGTTSVIDGQQRLTAFFSFIDGNFPQGTPFRLSGLGKYFNGKSYGDLSDEEQERISECTLRQILFRKDSDQELKFEIFKRLNSGSMSLNDQEMRNCVYRGKYNDLLCKLAKDKKFKLIMGFVDDHKRMIDVQYVLRFAALYFQSYTHYNPPMKTFMNQEMKKRWKISDDQADELKKNFNLAVASSFSVFGENSFRRWSDVQGGKHQRSRQFSASLYDVVMWSFTRYDQGAIIRNGDSIKEAMIHLTTSDSKFIDAITRATSARNQIETRFNIWDQTLKDIMNQEEKQPRCFSRELKQEHYDKNPTCAICGNKINHIDDAAMDHIEQYWLGGKTIPENARLVHRHCNATRPRKE